MMQSVDAIIASAAVLMVAKIVGWLCGPRVRSGQVTPGRGRPGRVRGLPTRVHGWAPWSRQPAETGATLRSESRAASAGVQGQPAEKPRQCGIGVRDQVSEFVAWILAELAETYGPKTAGRWTDASVWREYNRWAKQFSVITIPRCIFLKALAAHPQVERKRERILDSTGKALKLPSGTPMREVAYRIYPKRAELREPGKVPVGEAVPKQSLPTPSQRAAAKARQPSTQDQPKPQWQVAA
jgi:hypothetical protein